MFLIYIRDFKSAGVVLKIDRISPFRHLAVSLSCWFQCFTLLVFHYYSVSPLLYFTSLSICCVAISFLIPPFLIHHYLISLLHHFTSSPLHYTPLYLHVLTRAARLVIAAAVMMEAGKSSPYQSHNISIRSKTRTTTRASEYSRREDGKAIGGKGTTRLQYPITW